MLVGSTLVGSMSLVSRLLASRGRPNNRIRQTLRPVTPGAEERPRPAVLQLTRGRQAASQGKVDEHLDFCTSVPFL